MIEWIRGKVIECSNVEVLIPVCHWSSTTYKIVKCGSLFVLRAELIRSPSNSKPSNVLTIRLDVPNYGPADSSQS